MASLLLRDLPDHLHLKLKSRAKRNRRSVNSELLELLETALEAERLGRPTLEELDELRVRPAVPVGSEVVAKAKEEGRK